MLFDHVHVQRRTDFVTLTKITEPFIFSFARRYLGEKKRFSSHLAFFASSPSHLHLIKNQDSILSLNHWRYHQPQILSLSHRHLPTNHITQTFIIISLKSNQYIPSHNTMNVPSLLPNDTNNLSAPSGNTNTNSSINMADPANLLATTTPNSKPRQQSATTLQTYLYQDFANAEPTALNTGTCHERVPPHSLQSQKLPSKLAAMLSDPGTLYVDCWIVPIWCDCHLLLTYHTHLTISLSISDLTSVITWMPHGRSWKIINRELFSTFALPRYFGHSNHASFVRIVNAW